MLRHANDNHRFLPAFHQTDSLVATRWAKTSGQEITETTPESDHGRYAPGWLNVVGSVRANASSPCEATSSVRRLWHAFVEFL
jgi:hypothetical protein